MKANFEYSLDYFLQKLNLKSGKFVDVGANDGQVGSMTYDLEKNGWSGILIEPNPTLVDVLRKTRSSPVFPYAVSSSEGELPFYIVEGPGNLHGLSRFDYTEDFENHIKNLGGSVRKSFVKVKKLSSIINEGNSLDTVDFLKIDVEGHELEVLKSFDFEKYRPKLIVTEDNFKDENKAVRHFLQSKGYRVIGRDRINYWFAEKGEIVKFPLDFIHAQFRFLRWDAKRYVYSLFNKKIKTGNH